MTELGSEPRRLGEILGECSALLRSSGSADLAARVDGAGARATRPGTIVCVVGQFKEGKSSLVNGLLGTEVCPVDDDLATSVLTLVRHGDEPGAILRRRVDGALVGEPVPMDRLAGFVTEAGDAEEREGIERVDVSVPSVLLRSGMILVDTPGSGGLGPGQTAATLAFLPYADGLVFVTDSSAELTAPEVDFALRARELCPAVMFAQTKIDLHPGWRQVLEANRSHLAAVGLDVPMVPVSSVLRSTAMRTVDRDFNDASNFPALIATLSAEVAEPAKAAAASDGIALTRRLLSIVAAEKEQERELLEDGTGLQETLDRLTAAQDRLKDLQGAASSWGRVLSDRCADLGADVSHQLRDDVRTLLRRTEEEIGEIGTPAEWEQLSAELQGSMTEVVSRAFVRVDEARASIAEEIAGMLDTDGLVSEALGVEARVARVEGLWDARDLQVSTGGMVRRGLDAAKGAQSGIMMFGMLGRFLPAATAALVMTNPVIIGVGAVFGGAQVLEGRKRRVEALRQAARQHLRQYADEVQFQMGNELNGQVRLVQRELRDTVQEHLAELMASVSATAARAKADAELGGQQAEARKQHVERVLDAITRLDGELAAWEGGVGG